MFVCKRNCRRITRNLILSVFFLQVVFMCLMIVNLNEDTSTSNTFDSFNQHEEDSISKVSPVKKNHKFADFDYLQWDNNQKIILKDDEKVYFRSLPDGKKCFIEGTNFVKSHKSCVCVPDYYGGDCGIPDAVWFSHYKKRPTEQSKLSVRKIPRRIIHGVPVNHEFDFFETRIQSLFDVVDAFIVQESNFTSYGSAKDLLFIDRFQQGWLKEFQDKIIYIFLSHFPEKGKDSGWYADYYIRVFLSRRGLPLISNERKDDIFLLLDSDELPQREVLLFLKLYDGYTEPIRFGFRWTVFGFFYLKAEEPDSMEKVPLIGQFFRKTKERLLLLHVACTLGMLDQVYMNNSMLLRRDMWTADDLRERVKNYTLAGNVIKEWDIGTLGHYAGYHCSWCYKPEGIRTKLLSAQKDDSPRWGDYPEKTDPEYIRKLIKSGKWFDDSRPFIRVPDKDRNKKHYAPKFILENEDKYRYLLNHDYKSIENEKSDGL